LNLEQQWIENDFNPFILFSHEGKILSLNTQAQFLLGNTAPKEVYNLATANAPLTYGFKTTFLDISFEQHKFFGITVGYIDENELGIKLYRLPTFNHNNLQKPKGELTNIYAIIDLCIASNSITATTEFLKEYDPTIPDIIIDSSKLLQLLNQIYKAFLTCTTIKTKVYYKIGEYIKYDQKKYPLFAVEISANTNDATLKENLTKIAAQSCFYIEEKQNALTINLPIITS